MTPFYKDNAMDNIDVTKKINSFVRFPQLIIEISSAPGIIVNVSSLFSTFTIVSDITFRNVSLIL